MELDVPPATNVLLNECATPSLGRHKKMKVATDKRLTSDEGTYLAQKDYFDGVCGGSVQLLGDLADNICSGLEKVSRKPRMSIRTKCLKEMTNENLSARGDKKNATYCHIRKHGWQETFNGKLQWLYKCKPRW
ncbi:uncharacterized protein LOC131028589 [Cryptomeria japonica]|uniref:uncharacterized protein LOC131028589 n=1 Tax=Cryptomeria japonica TaxID=3369 RepID=UPI0027DA9B67|nr:uncharacterized protein LOC131028589 [Cryptomeria japonica]